MILFINIIVVLILTSCYGNNQIYFDEKESCIVSQLGYPICALTIIIYNDSCSDMWTIKSKTDKKDISISFKNIPDNYEINEEKEQPEFFVKRKFKILPNCKYEIMNHSYGDAAVGIIYIYSDSIGNLYRYEDGKDEN